ncbi:hypothetical protein ACQR1K_13330 [Bradyrhizobium sp. HKCCYLRH3095]|uniref:hypothetical protein n=1 Tax=unclassified Bradyrhizobium TaxID=2631580 RepID=UPI003EBDD0CE
MSHERAFRPLARWLKERGCNAYSYDDGQTIRVGYDTKPESDWGGRYTPKGRLIVTKPELFEQTCKTIERAYGWPENVEC